MINLKSDKNQKTNEIRLVQILFYTFPLWFIVGNLAVSLNTLLFIVVSLLVIRRKQLAFRFNNSSWLLIAFFLYLFISTTIQFLSPGLLNEAIQKSSFENNSIIKSLLLMRFLILIFVIDTLFFNKILNLKKLFLSSLICTSFVSFDIILQYKTEFDLFGYKRLDAYGSGPFGDEFIAGAYLKNFSFFSFFYIFEIFKNKNFNIPLLIFIIVLHLIATLLAGNRMPLLLFLCGCVLIILLIKNLRFTMFLSLLIFLLISFPLVKNDIHLTNTYKRFFYEINIYTLLKQYTKKTDTSAKMTSSLSTPSADMDVKIKFLHGSGYGRIFQTGILMWKEQPLTGFGLKSFRFKCRDMLKKDNAERKITKSPQYIVCANHPHNYYLELLSEAGIVGTSLMIIFFLILIKDSFFCIKKNNQKTSTELILIVPVIINILIEIWPIRSSGSFFTTWNATFFWLNVAIFLSAQSLFKTENVNYD